jgi:hypothetical protein
VWDAQASRLLQTGIQENISDDDILETKLVSLKSAIKLRLFY